MKTMRVLARGSRMVADYAALSAGARRFIGRSFDPSMGENGGWPAKKEPSEVPGTGEIGMEYFRSVRDGDLWAADEETARYCGVPFDPQFGGDFE